MPTDPKDRARSAFADLDTPEKTAFVIEATFSTIGAALRETGQRLGEAISEFDPEAFFRDMSAPEAHAPHDTRAGAPSTTATQRSTATKAAAAQAAATKPAARKTAPKTAPKAKPKPSSKTAGRSRKKKDDDA